MPKKPIRYSIVYRAREMFAVLMQKERESRSYGKALMLEDIKDPDHYAEFLKICMEQDASEDLYVFRKGLFLVLKARGISEAAQKTKIPRTTLYRMLWRGGNPNLRYLVKVLHYLGLRPWVVSEEFVYSSPTKRFRDEAPDPRDIVPGRARKVRTPKNLW